MKRFVSPVILIVGLLLAGFPGTAQAQTGQSAVTVTVPEYIAIVGLDDFGFNVTFPAGSGSGDDIFFVDANVITSISASVSQTTAVGTHLSASVFPETGAPGQTEATVTVSATGVLLTVAPSAYGETVTVTVTGPG